MRRNGKSKNLIWILAVLVLLTVLSAVGVKDAFPTSIALEQAPRCGMEEHIHDESCYVGDILVCREKMHTHMENCYLVLLEDNNINELLTRIDAAPDNDLETLISATVLQASAAAQRSGGVELEGPLASASPSPSVTPSMTPSLFPSISPSLTPSMTPSLIPTLSPSPSVSPSADPESTPSASPSQSVTANQPLSVTQQAQPITNKQIVMLNAVVDTSRQGVVLNENLVTANLTENSSEEELLASLLAGGSGSTGDASITVPTPGTLTENTGASTLAVGDTPSTTTQDINFYIWVDGERLVCVGTDQMGTYDYTDWWDDVTTYYIFTKSEVAALHSQSEIISNITTDNVASTYYVRYTTGTTVPTTSTAFGTTASTNYYTGYDSENLNFGTSNNVFHAILTTRSGRYNNYTYTPVDFYTFTFKYNDGATADIVKYVQSGQTVTKPTDPSRSGYTFGGWYTDEACTNAYDFSTTVTAKTTLYAKWEKDEITVTWIGTDGTTTEAKEPTNGSATFTVPELAEGYIWVKQGTTTPVTGTVTVDKDTIYVAVPAQLTVTTIDADKKETQTSVAYGGTLTLPNLAGYIWAGSDGTVYNGGETTGPITGNVTFTAISSYIVTYKDENGNVTGTEKVTPGETVTLPAIDSAYRWVDQHGNAYTGETNVTVTKNMTFTLSPTMTVSYTVNFPASISYHGATLPASPTIVGTDSKTAATDSVAKGTSTFIPDITDRMPVSPSSGHGAAFQYPFYFQGWETETGALIPPAANLTWDILQSYDKDGDGDAELTGKWASGLNNTVNFCINYYSKLIVGGGSDTGDYTPSLFTTYMGGEIDTGFSLGQTSGSDAYQANVAIRNMYGEKASGMWMYEFPADDDIFAALKAYANAGKLYVDNEKVDPNELDSEHYTIRWSVLFYRSDDGWHLDGMLVKKEGQITVDKVFGGIADAVSQARSGFYILAENGTVDANGTFTPYSSGHAKFEQYLLVLDQTTADLLKTQYPNATPHIYDQQTNSDGEIIDDWVITGVLLGEYWCFTEHVNHPTYTNAAGDTVPYSWYAEYTVTDSDGEQSAIAEFGSVAQVVGKTYALDENPDQGLTVDFTNYYYSNDSILIRKIDGDTGAPLGGAEFQLWQNGLQLKFVDNGNGIYSVSPEGTIGSITTNSEGFSVITIDTFSFDNGELVVREVTAPAGYAVVNDITVHYLNGKDGAAGITGIVGATEDQFDYHAEYHTENGGVLVVKDHSAQYTSVTVNKVWAEADSAADSVTVVLQANGGNAGILFPTLVGHEQVLKADNQVPWSYTWTDLPAYANGELVEWSVKEIKVGDDPTLADGVSFANWIAAYSAPTKTDTNGDGVPDNWAVTVTNTLRRTLIYLTKVDQNGAALSGVEFTFAPMEYKNGAWTEVSSRTVETDENGQIVFDNLSAGGYYKLTETVPDGYFGQEEIYVTIDGSGLIQQVTLNADGTVTESELTGSFHQYTNPYNLRVTNMQAVELPSTGGSGTISYTLGGALLMAAALLMLYKRSRRKEDAPYV